MGLWEGKAFLLAGVWTCYLDSGSFLGSGVDLENESHVFRKWVTEIEALCCTSVTNIILHVNCIEKCFQLKKKKKKGNWLQDDLLELLCQPQIAYSEAFCNKRDQTFVY